MAEGDGVEHTIGARTGTPDVFISYASHDTYVADNVAAAVEGQGLKCWIAPRDVTPGAHYASEIVHAIDSAKAIILILSQDAATSPHVLREIERATSKRHPVVTLRLDQAPLPAEFEYFLNTSQWLDASSGDATRMMPKLVAAVRLAIERSAGPAPATSATRAAGTAALAAIESEPDLATNCGCRVVALDALGRKPEADLALAKLEKNHANDNATGIAKVYASRRDLDQAFKWFDRGYRQHEYELMWIKVDPLVKNVQSDPRFKQLLTKLGLRD